jgi:hypothetical protein
MHPPKPIRCFNANATVWSGVRATVDGRTGDVRRFRTGHERYQRGGRYLN